MVSPVCTKEKHHDHCHVLSGRRSARSCLHAPHFLGHPEENMIAPCYPSLHLVSDILSSRDELVLLLRGGALSTGPQHTVSVSIASRAGIVGLGACLLGRFTRDESARAWLFQWFSAYDPRLRTCPVHHTIERKYISSPFPRGYECPSLVCICSNRAPSQSPNESNSVLGDVLPGVYSLKCA